MALGQPRRRHDGRHLRAERGHPRGALRAAPPHRRAAGALPHGRALHLPRRPRSGGGRHPPAPRGRGKEPLSRIVARHEAAWAERWRRASTVIIDGAPRLERALRFACYHLIAAAEPARPALLHRRAIALGRGVPRARLLGHGDLHAPLLPPRLAGGGARAHGLPPPALPGARRKAAALGFRGALYAWESAETGDETTPGAVVSPTGEILRVLSGEEEHHISADVAYAACACNARDGRRRLPPAGRGSEILVETARFWASRVEPGADGRAHVRRVIGPDEYHVGVDDNAFTNWMARFNLRRAADAVLAWPAEAARLGVSAEEARAFRCGGGRPLHGRADRRRRHRAVRGLLRARSGRPRDARGAAGTGGPDPRPRADAALADPEAGRRGAARRAPLGRAARRGAPGVLPPLRADHLARQLAQPGHPRARRPAARPARHGGALPGSDGRDRPLQHPRSNAAGGVHAAALGSLWQAVVLGAGGARPAPDEPDALVFDPHLPPGWRALVFPFAWRRRQLAIAIEGRRDRGHDRGRRAAPDPGRRGQGDRRARRPLRGAEARGRVFAMGR